MALTKKEKERIAKAAEEKAKRLRLANKKTTSREEDLKIMARKTGNTNIKLKPVTNEKKQSAVNSSVGAHNEPERNNDAQGKNESSGSDSASGNIHNNSAAETANNNADANSAEQGGQGAVSSDAKKIEETQQPKTDEAPKETAGAPEVKKELSLWGEVSQPTNEDKGIKEQIANTADAITNLADAASEASGSLSEMEAEEHAKKEGWKVKASITVELCDVGFMILCLLLTWDFNDENQKRFTLNPDRKRAIISNLVKVYALDNKKTNPKKEIMFLILGSYLPMLLVAGMILINRLKSKQQAKQAKQSFNAVQAAAEQENARLRQQLEAEQHKYSALNEMVKTQQPQQIKQTQRPEFINVPPMNKKQRTAPEKAGTGRGVKAGQKRGAYNKKK